MMVDHLATLLIRAIVRPVEWWGARRMARVTAALAASTAARECGCRVCDMNGYDCE